MFKKVLPDLVLFIIIILTIGLLWQYVGSKKATLNERQSMAQAKSSITAVKRGGTEITVESDKMGGLFLTMKKDNIATRFVWTVDNKDLDTIKEAITYHKESESTENER